MLADQELPLAKGTIYTVPVNTIATVSTLHVANESGAARTFTIYAKRASGTSRPISPVNQALDVDEIATASDVMVLTAGCAIEGVASGTGVSIVVTGREVISSLRNTFANA